MPTTPNWKAARTGLPSDLDTTNHATQITQFLGTHGITPAYDTNRVTNAIGGSTLTWVNYGNTTDVSQPFVMPSGVGTGVARLSIPLMPAGSGADVFVGLYPDNGSGQPNTANLLSGTKLPASWIAQLAARTGLASAGPLATPANNVLRGTGGYTAQPWAGPTGDATGIAQDQSVTCSGNYLIAAGGTTPGSVAAVVNTIPYLGGGTIGRGVPQPSLPAGTGCGMLMATSNSLVFAGGFTGSFGSPTPTSTVWVASWDSNAGIVGSWSGQTALPAALYSAACASSTATDTVYVIGGTNHSAVSSAVYYATVTNGQLSSWAAGPPLPAAAAAGMAAVVNGWLIVAGGTTSPTLDNSGTAVLNTSYFSKLNSDGSPGPWRKGPVIVAAASYSPGWDQVTTDSAVCLVAGLAGSGTYTNVVQTLTVSPTTGPAAKWQFFLWREFGVEMVAAFNTGSNGQWLLVNPNIPVSQYFSTTLTPAPYISCPISANLTAGSTYHVIIQQVRTASSSDYVSVALSDQNPLGGPDALVSARHSGTWSSAMGSGWGVPLTVYSNLPAQGNLLGTWEDPAATGSSTTNNTGARVSSLVYNQYNLPVGFLESTTLPNDPLNANPTFTAGVTPWVAHNGTITQSSAQTHGGYASSGLLTPTGGTSTASVTSELVPIRAVYPLWSNAQWYQVNGWLYSPTGWSSVSLSIDWYDATSTYLSTSSTVVSLSATTWTNLVNTYQPPANAAFASINATESGTPGATNLLYLSNVTLALPPELAATMSSVAQINYAAAGWPPTGVTQLA